VVVVGGGRDATGGVEREVNESWWWYVDMVLLAEGLDESSSATLGSDRTGTGGSVLCVDP
jgi:hypothetical protein